LAGISKEHSKIMFISGMGFFTDAYDLFVIGQRNKERCVAIVETSPRIIVPEPRLFLEK
jgi:hypothetical protein